MNEQIDPIEERIIGAVQRELDRFGTEIADRFAELQHHAAAETAARLLLESQVAELQHRAAADAETRSSLEGRLDDLASRLAATGDDLRSVLDSTRDHVERLDAHTENRFATTALATEQQRDELVSSAARLDDRLTVFEEASAGARHEVAAMVERVDAAADGLTERVARFDEDRVAMDARLDRLDRRRNEAIERLDSIEERLGGIDAIVHEATLGIAGRVDELAAGHDATSAQLETVRQEMAETDAEAIDEIKERVSSALGQTELVRIEVDRFQEMVKHDLDASVTRLTAIETAVQDQRMDVETAVQLERLEEVERMVLMLDPAQGGRRAYDPGSAGRREHDASPTPEADESASEDSGFDAVIAEAEARAAADRAASQIVPRLAPSAGF